jgi:hypothetical protein
MKNRKGKAQDGGWTCPTTISYRYISKSREIFAVKTNLAVSSTKFCQSILMKAIFAKALAVAVPQGDDIVM